MQDRRRLLHVEVFHWVELLQLIEQGWVTHLSVYATKLVSVEVRYNVVTDPDHRYVWCNRSDDSHRQNMELAAAYKVRVESGQSPAASK
jgi:hypothetical protein